MTELPFHINTLKERAKNGPLGPKFDVFLCHISLFSIYIGYDECGGRVHCLLELLDVGTD